MPRKGAEYEKKVKEIDGFYDVFLGNNIVDDRGKSIY